MYAMKKIVKLKDWLKKKRYNPEGLDVEGHKVIQE